MSTTLGLTRFRYSFSVFFYYLPHFLVWPLVFLKTRRNFFLIYLFYPPKNNVPIYSFYSQTKIDKDANKGLGSIINSLIDNNDSLEFREPVDFKGNKHISILSIN